jgi:hypothetical protein
MSAQNLSGILTNLTLYLPPLLVTAVLGPEQSGFFYIPWLIGTALLALTWNVVASLVVEAATDPSHIRAQLRHAFRLLVAVCVGGGAVLALGAPLILTVLGAKYAQGSADSLRLIGLAVPFSVIGTLFAVTGFMSKKTWPMFFSQLAGAVVFLGGAYVAMARLHYGAAGAAGAFLVSEVVVSLVLVPLTVLRVRELIRSSEARAAELAEAPTRVIPVSARGVATVPRLRPGYHTGPMQVLFLPAEVVDWERLGQIETVLIDRLSDGLSDQDPEPDPGLGGRWRTDLTLPLRRMSSSDTTVILPRTKHRDPEPGR